MSVCLIVNLSFYDEKKIEFFKKYYLNKFDDIYFTCPWPEDGLSLKNKIVPVFYSYNQWYGNAADVIEKIDILKFDYIVAVSEEGIFSSWINGTYFSELLHDKNESVVIPYAKPLFGVDGWHWYHTRYSIYPFIYSADEWKKYLMPYNDMLIRMIKYFGYYDIHLTDAFFNLQPDDIMTDDMRNFKYILGGQERIPYPLAYGVTDFIAFDASCAKIVCEQFRYWAAVGVFYEIALPTIVISLFDKANIYEMEGFGYPIKTIPNEALSSVYDFNLKQILERGKSNSFIRFDVNKITAGIM